MMDVSNISSGYALSGNPIIVTTAPFAGDDFIPNGGTVGITIGSEPVYEGRFSPPLNMDISEIIDAFIKPFPDADELTRAPLMQIVGSEEFAGYQVGCRAGYLNYDEDVWFTAIPGGISKQNYRRLAQNGTDIFRQRLLNPAANFFLTTRAASWRIVLKETELYPLYFLVDSDECSIEVVEATHGLSFTFDNLEKGVAALDFQQIRRLFFEEEDLLANVFDIRMSGAFSCRVIIEQTDVSKERYRLKFRNSLGVFEIVEIEGQMSVSSEFADLESSTFERFNSATGDFYADRERVARTQTLNIVSIIKRSEQFTHLIDMIASDDVYLLDFDDTPLKVIPTVEDFEYDCRQTAPQSFSISLTLADKESRIMEDISDGEEYSKPRVFSPQYSETFD